MKPTAAPPHFPYLGHRTMAQVMREERLDAYNRRSRGDRSLTFPVWSQRTHPEQKTTFTPDSTVITGLPPFSEGVA